MLVGLPVDKVVIVTSSWRRQTVWLCNNCSGGPFALSDFTPKTQTPNPVNDMPGARVFLEALDLSSARWLQRAELIGPLRDEGMQPKVPKSSPLLLRLPKLP